MSESEPYLDCPRCGQSIPQCGCEKPAGLTLAGVTKDHQPVYWQKSDTEDLSSEDCSFWVTLGDLRRAARLGELGFDEDEMFAQTFPGLSAREAVPKVIERYRKLVAHHLSELTAVEIDQACLK